MGRFADTPPDELPTDAGHFDCVDCLLAISGEDRDEVMRLGQKHHLDKHCTARN